MHVLKDRAKISVKINWYGVAIHIVISNKAFFHTGNRVA